MAGRALPTACLVLSFLLCLTPWANPAAQGLLILRGCESGDWWENHLSAIGVSQCPEGCASCAWGVGKPNCSIPENQKRVNQALAQNGLVILNHPTAKGNDCWPGGPIEQGWARNKMRDAKGYHAIEISGAVEEWKYILGLGRRVWGVIADDFHNGSPGTKGWIVVNSGNAAPGPADIIESIKQGNFYSVHRAEGGGSGYPAFKTIDVLGNIVSVTFRKASEIRFIDCTRVLDSKTFPDDADVERSASYVPGNAGTPPMPKAYLRVELEDRAGNIAYSQPLQVIGASVCPDTMPAPTCSKNSCSDLPCCTGYHCCGDRCYPNSMQCP